MPGLKFVLILLIHSPSEWETPKAEAEPLPQAEEHRRDALTRFGLGRWRELDDRPASALREYETAALLDPESPEPLRPLVQLYTELGRDSAAIRTAEKVVEQDPDDFATAQTLGQLYHEVKRYNDAVGVLLAASKSPRLTAKPANKLGILQDLARSASDAGLPDQAQAALQQAIKLIDDNRKTLLQTHPYQQRHALDRTNARLHEQLGDALKAQKKFDQAAQAYRVSAKLAESPELANDPQRAARLNWNLAQLLAEQSRTAEALAHLQPFLEKEPRAIPPYRLYVSLLRQQHGHNQAMVSLRQLELEHTGVPEIAWARAAEIGKLNPKAGHEAFSELLFTTASSEFFELAVQFYSESRLPGLLLESFDKVANASHKAKLRNPFLMRDEPEDKNALNRLQAFTAAIRSNKDAAKQLLQHTASGLNDGQLTDNSLKLIAGLAESHGMMNLAEQSLRAAGAGEADADRDLNLQLLEILAKQRKWKELQASCERLNRMSRQAAPLAYDVYLAQAYAEQGDARAITVADSLVGRVVADGELWASLQKPRMLILLGRYREAVAICEQLLKDNPRPADGRRIRFVLADGLLGLGEYARSEAELRTVLEYDPDDVLALNNLGYNLADQGRKLVEAESMIRRAIAIDRDERARTNNQEPESGIYLDSLGWVLFRQGKLAEARAIFEKAAKLPDSASDPVVWDHLGDVAFRQADYERAHSAWKQAADLYQGHHQGHRDGRRQEVLRKLSQIP